MPIAGLKRAPNRPARVAIPLTVSSDTLARLSPSGAVDLARRMIIAEAASAGVRTDGVRMSSSTSAPDGGVDIEVENAPRESDGGLIKRGRTAYQVESGEIVPPRGIARMLFGEGDHLKDGIRRCLDGGGTFVVILTGRVGPGTGARDVEKSLAMLLSDRSPRHSGPAVRVWDQGSIMCLLERHPSLALLASDVPAGLHTHAMWSSRPDMRHAAHLGPEQRRFVDDLRDCLRADGSPILVQVTGAPGAGKTRLVLEATRGEAHSGRIVYADSPDSLRPLLNHMSAVGSDVADLVVVVDGCTHLELERTWYEVQNYKKVKMVAITGEPGIGGANTCHLPVPGLGGGQIGKILGGYAGHGPDVEKWIGYCRPSPRVAHIVGASLKENPGGMPESMPGWERYADAWPGQEPGDVEARRVVLRWMSLFKTIKRGRRHECEIGCVAALVKEHHGISKGQFLDTVERLRSTRVIHGETELCITPKLLHLRMWASWWSTYTADMAPKPDQLVERGSRRLLQSYIDMFRYAKDSAWASGIVKGLLAPGGVLESDGALKSRLGGGLFDAWQD